LPVPETRVPEEAVAVEQPAVKMAPAAEVEEKEDDFLISRSAWTPQRRVVREELEVAPFADLTNSREKPLSSSRFGRKAAKPSPEGKKQKHRLNRYSQVFNSPASSFGLQRPNSRRSTSPTWLGILLYARKRTILLTATAHVVAGSRALRVSRPRRGDTLENTWKAITEGRAPPLARHLKKADTFDMRPGGSKDMAPPAPNTMQKAEVQHGDAAAAAGLAQALQRDGQPLLKKKGDLSRTHQMGTAASKQVTCLFFWLVSFCSFGFGFCFFSVRNGSVNYSY
jgi:hypothetical protein